MLWVNRLLIIAMWMIIVQISHAQHHYNTWFRSTLSIPISEKLQIDTEFQHRRQNGFESENMLDKNLMFSYRNWGHYQHSKNVKFSVSPFAYFKHYRIIQNHSDETAKSNSEVRFSAAVELQHRLLERVYILNRSAVEYRIFSSNQPDIIRLRNRFGFRYDFTEKLKLGIFDELLVNVSGTSQQNFFDHNRLDLSVDYSISPNVKIDFGYLHIARLPLLNTTNLYENNLYLNLTYQLTKRKKAVSL